MSAARRPRSISARRLLFSLYGSLLLLALSITVWLLTSSAETIVRDVVRQAATSSQKAVKREVEHFLDSGESANRQVALAFRSSRVDVDDPRSVQRIVRDAELVTESGSVSNIYVGLRDGRFYGLSAQPGTWPTLFWMHTESSPRTDGKLVYSTDMNSGEPGPAIKKYGSYDPRVRAWYLSASEVTHSIWTDVYANYGDGTPTVTRSVRLRGPDGRFAGAVGTDLFIPHLQRFLSSLSLSSHSEVFVLDADSQPIAAWGPAAGVPHARDHSELPLDKLRYTRLALEHVIALRNEHQSEEQKLEEQLDEFFLAGYGAREPGVPAAALPQIALQDEIITGTVTLDGEHGFLAVATLTNPDTPPWQVGVFVPSSDYLSSVSEQLHRVVPLGALLVLFSLLTIGGFAVLVSKPLERLSASAMLISEGQFNQSVPVPIGREVSVLARTIDDMRKSLGQSFRALNDERQRATATLQSIEDGVIVINEHDEVLLLNHAAERLIGQGQADAVSRSIESALVARDARSGQRLSAHSLRAELASSRRDGLEIILEPDIGVELNVRLLIAELSEGADSRGAVLTLHDMTLARQLQSELSWAASHDALTELVNRRELVARITRAIDNARNEQSASALAFFDLADFSRINSEIGYGGGDELLRQIAARLLLLADNQQNVTVARIGGDEFVVLVEGQDVNATAALFESMRDDIARFQFTWIDRGFSVAVSVGALDLDDSTMGAAAALHDAGAACMQAKNEGSYRVRVYASDGCLNTTLDIDRDRINAAIDEKRFELVAQNVVSLKDDIMPNVELLLRLRGEDGEVLSPSSFLPAAERLGLARRLDRHVIELAFAALAQRSTVDRHIGSCAINLSGQTLGDPTFLPWILDAFARYSVVAESLVFEVTETATVTHLSVARRLMHTLSERGVQFALDDFGTGMCSFAYLKELPINILKIDGSFIMDMTGEWRSEALVRSMVELAKSLELKIVAECIEDEATLHALKAMGVDSAQGFYLHRPEPF